MKMNFTVGMGRNIPAYDIPAHARAAEECGFSMMGWVDQPNLSRDMYSSLTIAALSTKRIGLMSAVTDPITYHPSVTATGHATLNEVSGGRAVLGLGAGGRFGKSMRPRSTKEIEKAINFLRGYMAGEEVEWQGAKMHSEWSKAKIPIYLAVDGPKLCKLAGKIADGAIFIGVHPEMAKWRVELIHQGAEEAGRDPAEIDIWARNMAYIADTKEEARKEVSSYPTMYIKMHQFFSRDVPEIHDLRKRMEHREPGIVEELMSDSANAAKAYNEYFHEHVDAPHAKLVTQRMIDAFHLTGPSEGIRQQIEELGNMGVTTISTVLFTIFDKIGMMRKFSEEIMPHFRN